MSELRTTYCRGCRRGVVLVEWGGASEMRVGAGALKEILEDPNGGIFSVSELKGID